MNCLIVENQLHGVAIGPRGIGYISGNTIEGNGHEGIWCGGIAEEFGMNSKGGSKSVIVDNVISHNGLSGLSFDGGSYEVKNNKIFENWLWGLMIKSKSSTYLLNNDIFENKCGGIPTFGIHSKFLCYPPTPNTFLSISLNSISTDIPNASRSNSNTVKLIFNYETVHCFDGAPVASLDSHLSHVTYSAIVHLNQGSVSV
jgi:parallel beta-helix repeat protein